MNLYDRVVEFLILVGVWAELYYMLQKRRRQAIKTIVTRTLHRLILTRK